MHKVKLIRIASNHKRLRTPEIEGKCEDLPRLQVSFEMVAEPLDKNFNFRLIQTTPVESIENQSEKSIEFKTRNSHYRLEILEGELDEKLCC